jgi:hypothetical protein
MVEDGAVFKSASQKQDQPGHPGDAKGESQKDEDSFLSEILIILRFLCDLLFVIVTTLRGYSAAGLPEQ